MIDQEKLKYQKEAGRVAGAVFKELKALIKPGVNVLAIAKLVTESITDNHMEASFNGFNGYPADCCISVNNQVVHAIPVDRILEEGDRVTVDLGVTNHGWIVDAARTYRVGAVSPEVGKLITSTREALESAIKLCRTGKKIGELSHVIQTTVERANFFIIQELQGHGVGRSLQEKPGIPNYGSSSSGAVLKEGMSIAIEPITAVSACKLNVLADGWTIVTDNGVYACQEEETVFITEGEPIVLTREP